MSEQKPQSTTQTKSMPLFEVFDRLGPRGAGAGDTDVRLVTNDEQEQPGDRGEE